MITRRTLVPLLVAAIALPLAAVSSSTAACAVDVTVASAADPHLEDRTGDWHGVATGYEDGTVPGADLYREGIDITAGWLSLDEAGDLTANIEVANLSTLQPNAIFYFLWNYNGSDAAKSERFVSARLKGYDVAFSYGYRTTSPVTGNPLFFTSGDTTGTITEGAPGIVSVDVPKGGTTIEGDGNDDWGAPTPGATLSFPQAESRFLLGSPEQLPPNPSGLRHGFVYDADNTEDATKICDATVPA